MKEKTRRSSNPQRYEVSILCCYHLRSQHIRLIMSPQNLPWSQPARTHSRRPCLTPSQIFCTYAAPSRAARLVLSRGTALAVLLSTLGAPGGLDG